MQVYSELVVAYFERLTADPSTALAEGRFYYHTTSDILKWYTGAAWKTAVDTNSSQVLTAKDYDGGTASNTSRFTAPSAAIATVSGLTRKAGTFAYATDTAEKRLYCDDGTNLMPVTGPKVTSSTGSPTNVTTSGITPSAGQWFEVLFIQGSGGAVDVTADPQIVAGTKIGQMLWLIAVHATQTVTLDNGTGLAINGTRVMGSDRSAGHTVVLGLLWNGTTWQEVFAA